MRALRLVLVLAIMVLAGCEPARHFEAALMLEDVVAGDKPSWLKARTAPPIRTAIRYSVSGRDHAGDLYTPGEGRPLAGVVLVPGAVPQGKDDPRLVAFATTLARARFAVLAPELAGFRQLKLHPSDVRVVADAFSYLAGRMDLAPAGRAGLVAFSYSVGPALLAALKEDVRERVRFLMGVGGYHDLRRVIRYFTTGYFMAGEQWSYLPPSEYGKLILVSVARPHVEAGDAQIFKAMIERRLKDRTADLSDLAGRLGPSGRAVYALAVNTDPDRFPALYAALPKTLRADIESLSLQGKDLDKLEARLILVHGRSDNLIPYPESEALAAAAPPSRARLYLIHAFLGHVDLSLSHILTWQFLTHGLPDIVRLWLAADALLAERAASPVS